MLFSRGWGSTGEGAIACSGPRGVCLPYVKVGRNSIYKHLSVHEAKLRTRGHYVSLIVGWGKA
jgi:hypothetical protein